MDINIIRSVVTVVSFVAFVSIVVWAYSKGAKQGFDEAAQLPFSDEGETPAAANAAAAMSQNEGKAS